jgi:hypothetical protein
MGGVHIVKIHNETTLELEKLKDLKFECEPLHVASSSILPNHAAYLLKNGKILLWDSKYDGCTTWADPSSTTDNNFLKSCEFGSHPRSLLISQLHGIETADLRVPFYSSRSLIFNVKDSEFIASFKRNPKNPFHVASTTNHRTALIDTRYAFSPLLEWGINNSYETQPAIEFFPDGVSGDSSFI